METYRSSAEAAADKAELKRLLSALNAAKTSLRLDECRAWRINGRRGHIAAWGDGKSWLLFVQCRSARHWTATKARLSFCRVTQDGDDEGVLRLDRLPTKAEAAAIRKALAIRQTGPAPANAFEFSSANEGFRAPEPAEAPRRYRFTRPAPVALKPPFCRSLDHLPHQLAIDSGKPAPRVVSNRPKWPKARAPFVKPGWALRT
jgi:hypothetical protein